MGFFKSEQAQPPTKLLPNSAPKGVSLELLHRMECRACPLNHAKCRSPKMQAIGSDRPRIYVLGTAPTDEADDRDDPWVGAEARLVTRNMTNDAFEATRFNNIIRTYPGAMEEVETKDPKVKLWKVKEPNFAMIESCRPSIVKDIEESRPEAVFVFGNTALKWVNGETHPGLWQGRRMPVRIGNHECWLYPFSLPSDVMKGRRWEGFKGDDELAFELYLRRACDEVMGGLPEPRIHSEKAARANVECYDGSGGDRELDDIEDFLLKEAPRDPEHGFDLETNRKRPYNKEAKLLSFAVSAGERTLAVGVEHKDAKWSTAQRKRLFNVLYEYLMSKRYTKAVHSSAFELEWMGVLLGREVIWGGHWDCTMSQGFVLNETQGLLSLESLCVQHFGINIKALSMLDRKRLEHYPLDLVLPYNGIDAKYHRELFKVQDRLIDKDGMRDFYEHFNQRPMALVLTQIKGIPVDQKRVQEYRDEYEPAMRKAEKELAGLKEVAAFKRKFGEEYTPSNSNHLAKMLKLAGHKLATTKGGGDAVDVKNIKGISHPVIAPTIAWKQADKMLSVYVDAVTEGHEKTAIYDDGRAHIILSSTKVTTSRTSSEDFNVQNWPKRNENKRVRRIVKARPGYKIVSCDYASIQGRNIAMESRDPKFMDAFVHDYDMHKDWLKNLLDIVPAWAPKNIWQDKETMKIARNAVKNQFVFPTFFGARPSPKMVNGLMQVYGLSPPEPKDLEELQEMLFDEFPDVKKWQEKIRVDYTELGYVTGLSGHRRHAPVEYTQLINAPIQADETIIVLSSHIALTKIDPELFAPCMEIHDDLTLELPERGLDDYIHTILTEMTKVRYDWINPVPLEVELTIGDDWASQEDSGKFKNRPDGKPGYIQIQEKK